MPANLAQSERFTRELTPAFINAIRPSLSMYARSLYTKNLTPSTVALLIHRADMLLASVENFCPLKRQKNPVMSPDAADPIVVNTGPWPFPVCCSGNPISIR